MPILLSSKKILCVVIVFFDFDIIRKTLDFLIQNSHQYDLVVVENPSEFTENLIKPYIISLLESGKINSYILFDKNITNNAIEVVLDSEQLISWSNYGYVLLTDGDLTVNNNSWLQEELNVLSHHSDVFACAVGLDMSNLPIQTFPDAKQWIPAPIQEHDDYTETLTGIHLILLETGSLLQFLDWRKKNRLKFVDSTLHNFCYQVLHKKWVIVKESKAKHLTWDSYQDLNHPYTQLKLSKNLTQTWKHDNYSSYTVYCKDKTLKVEYYSSSKETSNLPKDILQNIKTIVKKEKDMKNSVVQKFRKLNLKTLQMFNIFDHKRYFDVQLKRSSFDYPYKLHLGCGNIKLSNWINIDGDPLVEAVDIVWDLSKPIPLNDKSCQLLYCEHFLEHLDIDQGLCFLAECHRLLKDDGVLRIAVPSLE